MVFAVFKNLSYKEQSKSVAQKGVFKHYPPFSTHLTKRLEAGWAGRFLRHLIEVNSVAIGCTWRLSELPSSIFFIRTLRSTTSFSAWNCSLSEVTSSTIVDMTEVFDGNRRK
jgi:hypothetical protein